MYSLMLLLLLVSCGKMPTFKANQGPKHVTTLFSKFESVDGNGLHDINQLDYRVAFLNVQLDVGLETMCDGTYGNTGNVNGAEPSRIVITGDGLNGIIQNGHTKYVGATNPLCREISKEGYTYSMSGDILTLCMINYDFCADYQAVK